MSTCEGLDPAEEGFWVGMAVAAKLGFGGGLKSRRATTCEWTGRGAVDLGHGGFFAFSIACEDACPATVSSVASQLCRVQACGWNRRFHSTTRAQIHTKH